jgi:subtilisin family serine protease
MGWVSLNLGGMFPQWNRRFMQKLRFLLSLLVLCLGGSSLPVQAAADTITLGKHEAHATRILARYKSGISSQSSGSITALGQANVSVRRQFSRLPNLVVLEANGIPAADQATASVRANALTARIQALRNTGLFEYVEPDYTVYALAQPDDSRFQDGTLWGLRNLGGSGGVIGADINAVQAWDITTGSTNVVVAVIDTGVRYTHQDLATQMWVNPGEIPGNGIDDDENGYIDDVYGINAITGSGDPMDDETHGTHCAGTIGAQANGGGGHVGVTWKVSIMALKFLSASGFGQTSDALECLNYAVAMGAKISNNSWGGDRTTRPCLTLWWPRAVPVIYSLPPRAMRRRITMKSRVIRPTMNWTTSSQSQLLTGRIVWRFSQTTVKKLFI